jgi:hypothetical protein
MQVSSELFVRRVRTSFPLSFTKQIQVYTMLSISRESYYKSYWQSTQVCKACQYVRSYLERHAYARSVDQWYLSEKPAVDLCSDLCSDRSCVRFHQDFEVGLREVTVGSGIHQFVPLFRPGAANRFKLLGVELLEVGLASVGTFPFLSACSLGFPVRVGILILRPVYASSTRGPCDYSLPSALGYFFVVIRILVAS